MRVINSNNDLKVQAIAGTYVVMFGMNIPFEKCQGFLGFTIHRTDHTENEAYYLKAMKVFTETDPGFPPGSLYSTKDHPIQSFQWADYSAKPGHNYTYTIFALKGDPYNLLSFAEVSINITTESPETGDHDIYFNRGIAASQEYIRRFGNQRPDNVPNGKAYEWLSRGLNEALVEFFQTCVPGRHALRIAAYEFNYDKFLQLVRDTIDHNVDIKVIYDARKDYPKIDNNAAINQFNLTNYCIKRTQPKSYISHNKFIVKLDNNHPVSVWTGSTNFSKGGIYGHSNVAHVVQDEVVAQDFMNYWNSLKNDPPSSPLKNDVEQFTPLMQNQWPNVGTSLLFSPRKDLTALQWYADLAKNAQHGLFMTFAFGMNDVFKEVYKNGQAPFRLALMEKITRSMEAGPARDAEEQKIKDLRAMPENVFAIGSFIPNNNFEGWVKETLTSLNSHVRFVHNKFMLVDPLSDDPIVISGSANFSDASTRRNDENMVITRGNKRVADIYLGEFMRLFTHHSFRESLQWRRASDPPRPLKTDNWWTDYYGNTPRSTRRKYFAKVDI